MLLSNQWGTITLMSKDRYLINFKCLLLDSCNWICLPLKHHVSFNRFLHNVLYTTHEKYCWLFYSKVVLNRYFCYWYDYLVIFALVPYNLGSNHGHNFRTSCCTFVQFWNIIIHLIAPELCCKICENRRDLVEIKLNVLSKYSVSQFFVHSLMGSNKVVLAMGTFILLVLGLVLMGEWCSRSQVKGIVEG